MYNMGGFGGGNMQQLMRQAQKMQQQMAEKQAEIDEKLQNSEYTVQCGGGMVEVTITGTKKITSIKINPQAVDPDDVEMLQDLIIAGVNQAIETANAEEQKLKSELPGGGMM